MSEPDGDFDTKEIEQVRVLGRGTWQTWRQRETGSKKEWVLHEEGITSLKTIAFVPVYGKRLGYMQATPPLLELAYTNVEHWQSKSDQQNILHVARVPILFAKMLGEGGITVGAGSAVKSEHPDGDLKFVEHTGAAIEAGRLAIPPEMAKAYFGNNFKVEDGKTVPYDAAGNKIFSPTRPGEIADFDEGLAQLVQACPFKDQILKGSGASGGGATGGNSGGASNAKQVTRAQYEAADPSARAGLLSGGAVLVD